MLKYRHESAALKVVVYIVVRQLDDADPFQSRINQRRAAVAPDAPSDSNLMRFAGLEKLPVIPCALQTVMLVKF